MEVTISKKDIEDIMDYIQNKGFVTHMNDAGLSFSAMGFALTILSNACEEFLEKMEEES